MTYLFNFSEPNSYALNDFSLQNSCLVYYLGGGGPLRGD